MGVRVKRYELRAYDRVLAEFAVRTDEFGEVSVHIDEVDLSARRLLPLPLAAQPTSGEALNEWLASRIIPKNRRFVDQILSQAGVSDRSTFGIIDVCLGLSINDAYWVVPQRFSGTWTQYNLYENQLDEALALVAYTGCTTGQRRKAGLSTEWTTDGQYPKAWRRIDGKLFLFKAGTEGFANSGMEPYSEYFASQVASALGVSHVSYGLEKWKGRLASLCELMHDKDTSFVPFWTATRCASFPATLAAAQRVSSAAFERVRDMYLFDALVCNTDRHANNYGFLRSSETGAIEGFAPLFDHNLALFPGDMEGDFSSWPQQGAIRRPSGSNLSFDEVAALVVSERHHEALRAMLDFEFCNHPLYPVPEQRLAALNAYIAARVRHLIALSPVKTRDLSARLAGAVSPEERLPVESVLL